MNGQKHLVDVRGLKEYFPVKSGMLNKMTKDHNIFFIQMFFPKSGETPCLTT